MKKLVFLFILCFLSSPATAQEDQIDYSEAIKLIEVWLDAQKDYEKLPGITAIVIDDQKVLWQGGFGLSYRRNGIEADPSTRFSICSISKLFTSVAIMKLYDEGKLRLDDRLSELLPWYNLDQQFEETSPITVRSLLTHSSGLPREAAYPYWTGPYFNFPSAKEVRTKLGEQETLYPASTYFQYSNLGLTLLGEIVKEISGMSYDEYIRKNILEPLEMTATTTDIPKEMHGMELAVGYGALNRAGERDAVPIFEANGIQAAAGFASTVEDLGKFASWQFQLLDTNTSIILKPSTLKFMQRVHWTEPDWKLTWGLGFSVRKGGNGKTYVGHGGSCPGYRSSFILDPELKRGFVVMINAGGTNPGKYSDGIEHILSKVKKAEAEEDEIDLTDYIGYYSAQPWASERYLGSWGGQLVSISLPTNNPGNSMTFFKHVKGDVFQRVRSNGEAGETLSFERDANGKIFRSESHGNYSRKMDSK